MSDRAVTKKFALKEFSIIGIIISLYAFFALYLPYIFEKFVDVENIQILNNLSMDVYLTFRIVCIVFASFVPFLALYASDRKYHDKNSNKERASLKDCLIYTLVFITVSSLFTYINSSVLSFFNVSSSLVSNIGLAIDSKYFDDILYICIYIIILPIFEEFAFRASLLGSLGKYGKRFAVLACSLFYALAHCNITEILPSLIMSYLLCKVYLKYRSLMLTSFIHIVYNFIMFLGFSISSEYNKYVLLFIFTIILITILIVLLKKYTPILLPKADFNKNTFWLFLSRKTVIFSLLLFITFAVLQIVI